MEYSRKFIEGSVNYLKLVVSELGEDAGMTAFKSLSDSFSPDLSSKVIIRILSRDFDDVITIPTTPNNIHLSSSTYIQLIRVVRTYTGMGLKEAKDICDTLRSGREIKLKIPTEMSAQFIDELEDVGIKL